MSRLNGLRVLIVDDEPMLAEVMSELLIEFGAEVHTSSGGKEALEFLKKQKVHVIISDVRMPEGDGCYLAENIPSEIKKQITVFFCSGFNDLTASKLKELGVESIFKKPFEIETILSTLENLKI